MRVNFCNDYKLDAIGLFLYDESYYKTACEPSAAHSTHNYSRARRLPALIRFLPAN